MEKRINKIVEKGSFRLIDHSFTHNQFLYRSYIEPGLNRDILISGVSYISLPMSIEGFQMYKGGEEELEKIRKKFDPYNYKKVFVFEQKHFKHYVVADRILIQENNYEILETSIPIKREAPRSIEELEEFSHKIKKEFDKKGYEYVKNKYEVSKWKILE